MKKGIITIDTGTTSMRTLVFDLQGHRLFIAQEETPPHSFDDGRVEQSPEIWVHTLQKLLQAAAHACTTHDIEPLAISLTAQRSSLIPVDKHGAALSSAIMWQDRRTLSLVPSLKAHEDLVYKTTGLRISPVFSALKMLWLNREAPELWAKTHKAIGIQDWLIFHLTGHFVTDHSFASRTNLFSLTDNTWSEALLSLFEVTSDKLCELVPPGAIVGGLRDEMAQHTGLISGLPIISAGGDQQCAALGQGLLSPKSIVSNTGTGGYLIGLSDRPVFDPQKRLACNVSALKGHYIVEAGILTSGAVYHWFQEKFYGGSPTEAFKTMNDEASAAPLGANGLLLLPHFKGSGSPHWDPESSGVFFNLTLSSTRGDMARAILEGLALGMKENLELIEALCGRAEYVSISGGMTRTTLFNQILSDALGHVLVRPASHESTAIGAWIAGMLALGLASSPHEAFLLQNDKAQEHYYTPNAKNTAYYAKADRQLRALYAALASDTFRHFR